MKVKGKKMKQEILDRIKELGGNIDDVKGDSLLEDFQSITFNTVLYLKPESTPWESDIVIGLDELINENISLFNIDSESFYNKVIDHYYRVTDEPLGQVFFKNTLFTPFKEGTEDFEEWDGEWEEEGFKEVIKGEEMDLMNIGYSYGYPDHYFICLSDPNLENPTVYSTDHETFFSEITIEGSLEEYFNSFISRDELIEMIKAKLEN